MHSLSHQVLRELSEDTWYLAWRLVMSLRGCCPRVLLSAVGLSVRHFQQRTHVLSDGDLEEDGVIEHKEKWVRVKTWVFSLQLC